LIVLTKGTKKSVDFLWYYVDIELLIEQLLTVQSAMLEANIHGFSILYLARGIQQHPLASFCPN